MSKTINNVLRQDILNKSIWSLMVKFSLPAIIAMSINSLNTFVDALFIGRYVGQEALAAVSLAFPLTMLTNGLSAMVSVGGSSLLSIAIGANQIDVQEKIFGSTTVISIVVSLALMTFGLIYAENLIELMGGSGNLVKIGALYYRIMMFGAFVRIYGLVLNTLIRAEGKMNEAMSYLIAATLLNIILNPIFIVVLDWGVEGAAWSTVVAMLVLTLTGLIYFLRGRANYHINLSYWRLEGYIVKPILSVGVSAMMMQLMFLVQQIFVFRSIAHYGNEWHIAFMGACYRIMIFMVMPIFGFSQALQPIVGINFGGDQLARVKEAFGLFAKVSTAMLFVFWVLELLFPEVILSWMLPDATFSTTDIFNFRIQMLSYIVFPFFLMGVTMFQSIGRARMAGFMLVARELAIFIPFVLLLPMMYGVDGIYYSMLPVNLIVFFAAAWLIRSEFKKWT
jgi:putative MATE family efflux protein